MGVPFSSYDFTYLELSLTDLLKNENKKFVPIYDVIDIIKRAGTTAIYAEVLEELRLESGITDEQVLKKIYEFQERSNKIINKEENH